MKNARASETRLRCRSSRGFILLDILVSLAISALVLSVFFEIISRNLEVTGRAADRYRAALYARSKFAALGSVEPLAGTAAQGRFDDVFAWSMMVSKDEALASEYANASLIAYTVTLDISWKRGPRTFNLSYQTIRLGLNKT